jgi:hypothetical protein
MKKYLLWSFERGSKPYDVIVALILAFIFVTPSSSFNDRPDFMRVSGEPVHQTRDDNGNTVYTVKVETPVFSAANVTEQAAVERLKQSLGAPFTISSMQPVYDSKGALVSYAIWIER